MYLWKCWREVRGLFFLLLVLVGGRALWNEQIGIERIAEQHRRSGVLFLCQAVLRMNLFSLVTGGAIAAIAVVALVGIAREFGGRRADLLYALPVRRRRLLWTNWLFAVVTVELTMLMVALASYLFGLVYCRLALLPHLSPLDQAGLEGGWPPLAGWPGFLLREELRALVTTLPCNLLVIGIATVIGVGQRRASRGTLAAAMAVGGSLVIWGLLYQLFGILMPGWWPGNLIPTEYLIPVNLHTPPFPVALFAGWTLAALLLPLAAQLILERRDIV